MPPTYLNANKYYRHHLKDPHLALVSLVRGVQDANTSRAQNAFANKFGFKTTLRLTCTRCGHAQRSQTIKPIALSYDPYEDLSCFSEISEILDHALFKMEFTAKAKFMRPSLMQCRCCCQATDWIVEHENQKLPDILVLHSQKWIVTRNTELKNIPGTQVAATPHLTVGSNIYRLKGILFHDGINSTDDAYSASCLHEVNGKMCWWKYTNGQCTFENEATPMDTPLQIGLDRTYMLFYEKLFLSKPDENKRQSIRRTPTKDSRAKQRSRICSHRMTRK